MPKRKADEDKRTKGAVRPSPPAASNDDEDSDFCDIIEGPSAPPGTAAMPPTIPPRRSVVASPLVPGGRANPSLPFGASHPHHDPNNAGVLSMLAGLSGAMPYMQPMHASGFVFHQMPVLQQRHSFGYGPPDMVAPQAACQGGRYPPGPSVARSVSSPVASSSDGMSSGAPSPAPPCYRQHASSSAQEVKEEPDDTALRPTEAEVPLLGALRAHGVPTRDAIQSLRRNGHNFTAALNYSLDVMTARKESQQEDMARLESEKEKDRVAVEKRLEEKTLAVLGDIEPQFQESLLLNEEEGCAAFRETVQRVCSGDEICTPALCTFREKAVNLLFLERDAFRHYRENHPQVRRYFRELIERLEKSVAARETEGEEGASGETADGKTPRVTGMASVPDFGERGEGSDCGRKNSQAALDEQTGGLTARITEEVEALQHILYMFPSTPGGVPDAFLERSTHAATLTADGVEELVRPSSAAGRSGRSEGRVVITVDD